MVVAKILNSIQLLSIKFRNMGVKIEDLKHSLPMSMVIEVTEAHTDPDGIVIVDKFELKHVTVELAKYLRDQSIHTNNPLPDPNSPVASVPRP